MNNEDKILTILEQMQTDIRDLKQGQAKLEQGQATMQIDTNRRFDKLEMGLSRLERNQISMQSDIRDLKQGQAELTSLVHGIHAHQEEDYILLKAHEEKFRQL